MKRFWNTLNITLLLCLYILLPHEYMTFEQTVHHLADNQCVSLGIENATTLSALSEINSDSDLFHPETYEPKAFDMGDLLAVLFSVLPGLEHRSGFPHETVWPLAFQPRPPPLQPHIESTVLLI